MDLTAFPRLHFAHLPTPLEPLPRLSAHLDGPHLYIKRDDCTGLATGGNKTRKLEFLLADAVAQGADTILTQGALQSNHVRQTTAIAAKLGLACHALLEHRVPDPDPAYLTSGNILLDRLFGATIHEHPVGTDMDAAMDSLADTLRRDGCTPYVIPGGGSNPVGALGYVECALELLTQAADQGLTIDAIVHATGSTGTQAGLLTGLRASGSAIPVVGINVIPSRAVMERKVFDLACRTAEHVGAAGVVQRSDVVADDGYVGPGYGLPSPGMLEAVRLTARLEGILLDPVYSGKGMAGLIGLIRQGHFDRGQNVVFIHTGGSTALFAYLHSFDES